MQEDDARPDMIEGLPVKRLLESFGAGGHPDTPPDPAGGWAGRILGGYELLEEIDRGGMGIVFRARQQTLGRTVAVKILRSASFAGEDELARFQGEAHTLGLLNHPNIVPIFDVGEEDGQPFLAMKWVDGGTLLGQVERCRNDPGRAAELMFKVSSAIHEAHLRGVLHRDLKPANILIDQAGEPHVTDFGLSRRLDDDTELTRSRMIVGSPNYLAPEQISRHGDSVTTAVDVFGLGAILYHLLTGRPPFEGDSALGVLKKVEEADPAPPSALNPKVDRDLETICLKCLRPDPAGRYPSAAAIAEDLGRWMRGEAIEARRLSHAEQVSKWSRRHPLASLLIIMSLVGLAAGVALEARHREDLRSSRDRALESQLLAQQASERLEATVTRLELERAEQEFAAGRQRAGIRQLVAVLERDPANQVAAERLTHEWIHRRFPIEALPAIGLTPGRAPLDFSADGTRAAAVDGEAVQVWNLADGSALQASPIDLPAAPLIALDLDADGSLLMMATDREIQVVEVEGGRPIFAWARAQGSKIRGAALTPDGAQVLLSTRNMVLVLDIAQQREVRRLVHQMPIGSAEFCISPDGESLVVAVDKQLVWWDLPFGSLLDTTASPHTPSQLAFSGDGSKLITANQAEFQIWDAVHRIPIGEPFPQRTLIQDVALDEDGGRCAIALVVGRTEILNSVDGSPWCEPIIEGGDARTIAFLRGSDRLASGSSEGLIRQWGLNLAPTSNRGRSAYVSTLAGFDRAHSMRVQRTRRGTGRLSKPGQSRTIPVDGSFWDSAISPDGSQIAVATLHGSEFKVRLLDGDSLEVEHTVASGPGKAYLEWSPDGKSLAVNQVRGGMVIWDCEAEMVRSAIPKFPPARKFAFADGGTTLIASNNSGKVGRWSVEDGERLGELCRHGSHAEGVALSPDGKLLVTGGTDSYARWWRLGDPAGTAPTMLGESEFRGWVNWVAFSPQGGKYFMAASRDGSACVWETATQQELCRIPAHDLPLNQAYFTPDGGHLVTVSMDATVRIWDAATGQPVTSPIGHDRWWQVPEVELPVAPGWLDEIRSRCSLREEMLP